MLLELKRAEAEFLRDGLLAISDDSRIEIGMVHLPSERFSHYDGPAVVAFEDRFPVGRADFHPHPLVATYTDGIAIDIERHINKIIMRHIDQ